MNIYRRLIIAAAVAGACSTAGLAHANANDWPTKPVKIIVPFAPGGSSDTLGRMIAKHLSETFKQSFVVENRGGAGGVVGSQQVARAEPDGYTLLVTGVASHVIAPLLSDVKFDPIKDFSHIAILGGPPIAAAVNTSLPVTNLKEFNDYASKQSGGLSFASPGAGTHGALIGDGYRDVTGLNLVHIPYKGASPAVADVAGNQVPAAFTTLTTAYGHVRSGKLRLLAISAAERLKSVPDVPTFKELGFPQLTGTTWFALGGPANMDPAIVEKINVAVRQAMKSPEGQRELETQMMETFDFDVPTFNSFIVKETELLRPLVERARAAESR